MSLSAPVSSGYLLLRFVILLHSLKKNNTISESSKILGSFVAKYSSYNFATV